MKVIIKTSGENIPLERCVFCKDGIVVDNSISFKEGEYIVELYDPSRYMTCEEYLTYVKENKTTWVRLSDEGGNSKMIYNRNNLANKIRDWIFEKYDMTNYPTQNTFFLEGMILQEFNDKWKNIFVKTNKIILECS